MPEPNMVLPLASSYNERGVAGFTHTVTNSEDQRKVNVFYEIAENITGKKTLTLSKRPGASKVSTVYGTATQRAHLIINDSTQSDVGKQQGASRPWVITKSTTSNIQVSNDLSTETVVFSTTYHPHFVDFTHISTVPTVVLQLSATSPTSVQRVFYSSSIATWTEIVDADFTVITHRGKMEHMDGFAFILDKSNIIWNSDSNSLSSWTASNFIAKQISQDIAVGLAKAANQILAFGEDTVEVFYNGGNETGSPLTPIKHLAQRVGMISPTISVGGHYYCTIKDRIFFVGRSGGGVDSAGVFTYAAGSQFEKVSTPYIDKILSENIYEASGFASVNSFGFHGQIAVAILLTSTNVATNRWLMFFPEIKEWFEWTSTVFSSINSGERFLGVADPSLTYFFPSVDKWQDDTTSYPWSTQFKLPTKTNSIRRMGQFGVVADTARSAATLTVEFSDDDAVSFQTIGTIDMTKQKKMLSRGGSFRERHVRLGSTDAVAHRLHSFIAHVT